MTNRLSTQMKRPSIPPSSDRLKPIACAPYDRRDYHVIAVGPVRPAQGGDTIYMQVHLDVFPPGLAPTLAAVKEVAEAARKGDGNLR